MIYYIYDILHIRYFTYTIYYIYYVLHISYIKIRSALQIFPIIRKKLFENKEEPRIKRR